MTPALRAQLEKESASVNVSDVLPILQSMHNADVCTATFDRIHESWLSNRSAPRGIVVLDRNVKKTLPYPPHQTDADVTRAMGPPAPKTPKDARRAVFLLEFQPTPYSLPGYTKGANQSTAGHV